MNASSLKSVMSPKQKYESYHRKFRCQAFQQRKQQIRLRNIAMTNLNSLVESLPRQLKQVVEWCEEIARYIADVDNGYEFPDCKVLEMFYLVKKYPCYQTIKLLYIVAHRITVNGVQELFQYDIVGLLHNIITYPQKISLSTLGSGRDKTIVQIDLVRYCIMAIAALCERNQKARNFIVTSHKSFVCIQKAYEKLGHQIRSVYIQALHCFVIHPMEHDEQFIKICRKIITFFTESNQSSQQIEQLITLSKALTCIIKNKQKWAMDLIQSQNQYNILETTLQCYDACLYGAVDKNWGELAHRLNMLMIHYIQTTTNDYFCWQVFFKKWFCILENNSMAFQLARQDVYFLINNALFEYDIEGYQSKSGTEYGMSDFLTKCLECLSRNLEKQTNMTVLMEMGSTLNQIFKYTLPLSTQSYLFTSNLLPHVLDLITASCTNYSNSPISVSQNNNLQYVLTSSLINLINNASNQKVRHSYYCLIRDREHELCNVLNFHMMDSDFCDKIQQLLTLVDCKPNAQL